MIGCRHAHVAVRSRARTAYRRRPPFAGGAMGNRTMFPIPASSRDVLFLEPMHRPCGPAIDRGEFGAMPEPARRTGNLALFCAVGFGNGWAASSNIAADRVAARGKLENSR